MPPRSSFSAGAPGPSTQGGIKPKRRRVRKSRRTAASDSSSSSSSDSSSDGSGDEGAPSAKATDLSATKKGDLDSSTESSSGSSSSSSSGSRSETDNGNRRRNRRSEKGSDGAGAATKPNWGLMNAPSEAVRASVDDGQEARRQRFSPDPSDVEAQSELSSDSSCRLDSDKGTNKSSRLESKLSKVPDARLPSLMEAQQTKVEAVQRAKQKSALDSQRQEEEKRGKPMDSEERRNAFRTFWLAAVTEEFGEELENMRKRDPSLSESLGGSRLPLLIDALASGSEIFSTGQPQSSAHLEGDNALMDVDEVGMLLHKIE
ncbi:hypothetical protein IE81DRAFT_116534 [Ceraceosorus guamensis]|uniref:Ribosome assembly protein 3 n=1 Tax=Ceraceosorus guamensis TaxID=1522189 RepID=A0A316VYS4_9BASI|nr:hypothetical protein IE81DRAFT_116534 [Ceraceosorus guamensis]PWN42817.1 hypothetical protein IE81DRAFT_116534 [Ceraceosorus guamensis]